MLRDAWNFLSEWGMPVLAALLINLAVYFVAVEVFEGIKQFAQDVHTIAESVE